MSRWPILVFAVVIAGCGKPEPTRPAATEPEAPGVAAATPAAPDTLAPPAPPEAPKTAPTIPPPSDPVDRFSQALVDTKDCPRTDDGLLVANPTSCLVEVTAAREALIHPTSEVANTPEAREELRRRMADALGELLNHLDPTVAYYAMKDHQPYYRATPAVLASLDKLMSGLLEPVAEAAATIRFGLMDADPKMTQRLALATFAAHSHLRVQHAACRHLGSERYKGDRGIFERFVATARDTEADLLLRSCAALQAGHVATRRNVKKLLKLLALKEIQQPTILGLQRGMATPKAYDGYVQWFEKNATNPEAIHWSAMHAFLPWEAEMDRMPRTRAIDVLTRITAHTGHATKTRLIAVEGLRRLKASDAIDVLAAKLAPDDAPDVLHALGR